MGGVLAAACCAVSVVVNVLIKEKQTIAVVWPSSFLRKKNKPVCLICLNDHRVQVIWE